MGVKAETITGPKGTQMTICGDESKYVSLNGHGLGFAVPLEDFESFVDWWTQEESASEDLVAACEYALEALDNETVGNEDAKSLLRAALSRARGEVEV